MLRLHCVPSLRHCVRADTSVKLLQSQCRSLSSTPLHNIRPCPGSSRPLFARLQPSWPAHQNLSVHFNPTSFRFASTDVKATPIAEIKPVFPSKASQPVPDASLLPESTTSVTPNLCETPNSLDYIIDDGQPQINEYIGYLRDMGLDYGWGTTSLVETILEYVHIYSGTAWWASIALTVIAIRLSFFKLYINAQDSSARQAAIGPLTRPLDERQKVAMAASDLQEVRATQRERHELNKHYGVKPLNIFLPIVIQIPMGFGTFRLMRGMATLPVPGFDQGGFLWLSDLTLPDPFYILPLATAATYYYTFKLGGESGGAASTMSPTMYRLFLYVLPCMTGFFAMWWPVGLQIPIFLNGVFAISQNMLFRQPWFRALCGIQPLGVLRTVGPTKINQGPRAAQPATKGFVNSVKNVYSEAVDQGKKFTGKTAAQARATGRSDAEIKKAKAYEEKIAREVAQRKFEAKQAKEAREEERRQR